VTLVAVLAVKLLSQPTQSVAGSLIGNLGVDLQGDCDLAVAKYPHRNPRVHIERRQQGGAGPAHTMRRDVAHPGGVALSGEVPGEIAGLVGRAVAGGDYQGVVAPGLPSVVPPGCLLLGLKLDSGGADRGRWQRGV
jgi:hypothetical protein